MGWLICAHFPLNWLMPQVCCPSACRETPATLITLVWYLCMCVYFCCGLRWPVHPYMYACPVFSLLGLPAHSQAISGSELRYPDPRGCLMMSLTGNWVNLASKFQWRTPYVYPVIWAVPVWTRGWTLARFATSNICSALFCLRSQTYGALVSGFDIQKVMTCIIRSDMSCFKMVIFFWNECSWISYQHKLDLGNKNHRGWTCLLLGFFNIWMLQPLLITLLQFYTHQRAVLN